MLPDRQIRFEIENSGEICITPYNPKMIQPASIDLTLGSEFIRYVQNDVCLDPEVPDSTQLISFEANRFVLHPGEFVLATTVECLAIGSGIGARVEGKSTLGRLGLNIHITAGFIDPGFQGNITLEMKNDNVRPIVLRAGMKICQIAFYRMESRVEKPYGHEALGSHYQNQTGVTPAVALL